MRDAASSAGQPGQPVDERPRGRQTALEQPSPQRAPCDDHGRTGRRRGRCRTGTDTFAVVPHDTIGQVSDEPAPRTSQARSPAPITTGMPAGEARAPSAGPPSKSAHHGARRSRHRAGDPPPNRRARQEREPEPAEPPPAGRRTGHPHHHVPRSRTGPVADARVWSVVTSPVRCHAMRSRGASSQRAARSAAGSLCPSHANLGRHRSGVEHHTGAPPHDVAPVLPERLRQGDSLRGRTPVRPQRERARVGWRRRPPGRRSDGPPRTRGHRQPRTSLRARAPDSGPGLCARRRPPKATMSWHPARPGSRAEYVQSRALRPTATGPSSPHTDHLGDAGAEVDGEDHAETTPAVPESPAEPRNTCGLRSTGDMPHRARPARARRRPRDAPSWPVRGPGTPRARRPARRHRRPWRPGSRSRTCSRGSPPTRPRSRRPDLPASGNRRRSRRGPPRKSTGTPTLATMRATASTRAAPGATSGTGTLSTGAPRSWATMAAYTIESVSRAAWPSRHDKDSTSAVEPERRVPIRAPCPSSSRAGAVTGSARSMRVMCLTPVQPSAAARSTLATERSSSSNALAASPVRLSDRYVRCRGSIGTRRRQVAQGLCAGQDAVAERRARS